MEEQKVVYKLKKPFKMGDTNITEVVLSEPPASKLRGVKLILPADKNVKTIELDVDTALTVMEVCCENLHPPEMSNISIRDLNDIYWKCIELFFG